MNKDVSRNFRLWAEMVDLGIESILAMFRKKKYSRPQQMRLLKQTLDEQSMSHHKANIRMLRRLSNVK